MTKDVTPVPYPKGDGCLLAKVNALRGLQPPSLHFGAGAQSASGDSSQVAPALWADVDNVPERSEWDAVHFG